MRKKGVHYLRSCRRRACLSQHDLASLLGGIHKTKISRHERYKAEPTLRAALAYQAIFKRPVAQIFHGAYREILTSVRTRAADLLRSSVKSRTPEMTQRRKESLLEIASR
jgi:DNA-binding XRE family transcriptional regulator